MVEGLEFASQFSPPCGTERQYLDMGPGQPTSPTTGRGEESEDNRTLKAAKSAARRLLEDLVREQERLDTLEPPTASHMPFSALEGARLGFLGPQQVQEFTQRANAAKNMAKMKPSAPPVAPPPPVPAQAPRTLPPPPRVPAQVHRDRFQPHPPMWIMPFPAPVAHPAPMMFPPPVARPTQMVPKPAPTMARWIARDTPVPTVPTVAPKMFSTVVPTVAPTTAPPPSSTTAPPPSPTTAPPPSPKTAPLPVTTTMPKPSTSMTPAAPHEAPNENQLMAIGIVPMRLWDASGPPPMPTTGPPMPPADLSMPTPTVTMGPKMLPSTKVGASGARDSSGCAGSRGSGEFILRRRPLGCFLRENHQLAASSAGSKMSGQPEASSAGCIGVGESACACVGQPGASSAECIGVGQSACACVGRCRGSACLGVGDACACACVEQSVGRSLGPSIFSIHCFSC